MNTCIICKKEFKKKVQTTGLYCSPKCYWISLKGKKPTYTFPKGYVPWNAHIGRKIYYVIKGRPFGEKNHKWKGDKVGYFSLHNWVKRKLGKPKECVYCGRDALDTRIHWASISHKAKRDINDYISLCPSCHWKYDRASRK
jgi:hypothetical protein